MAILPLVLDIAILLSLFISAIALGQIILRRSNLTLVSPLEQGLFSAGLGLTVFVYAILCLATVGGLYPIAAWVIFFGGLLVAATQIRRFSFLPRLHFGPAEMLFVALLSLFAILALVAVLAPPTDWDSLMYHLEVPKRYIQAHGYVYIPNAYSNFPQFVESLYLLAMLLRDDILARLVNLAFGGLAILTVYAIARRFVVRSGALLASLIFISSPLVSIVFIEVYVEAGLTFYSLLTILALLEWQTSGNQRWLWLGAALVGITLGIKYYGIILVPIWVWAWLNRAGRIEHRTMRDVLSLVAVAMVFMLVPPLPWLIKNFIFVGDPVFPVISGLLGHWGRGIAQANWAFYGMGYHLLDYVLLPWRMTFGDRFGVPKPGPLFLILLPSLIGLVRVPRAVRWLTGLVLVWFVFWANSAGQSVRFFLSGLALLSVILVVAAHHFPLWSRQVRLLFSGITLMVVIYHLIWPAYFASLSIPYITGQQSRSEYLTNRLNIYPIADYANHSLPPSTQIATVWEERGYYFDRPLVIGQSPDGAFLHRFIIGDDPTQLVHAFFDRDITHLIINDKLINNIEFNLRDRYIYGVESQSLLVYQPAFRLCFLRPLYNHQVITLYEILPESTCVQ